MTETGESDLVTAAGIDPFGEVGDMEYFVTTELDAPYYNVQNFALPYSQPFGSDWDEKISAVTNRGSLTQPNIYMVGLTPAGGSDYFTRVREGESDYAYISLVGDVTTNGAWGAKNLHKLLDAKGNVVEQNKRERMELIGDHTWRYNYYIPTNAIGEKIRFHFEGLKYETGDEPFKFNITTNIWYANSTNVPYLPYTMAATGTLADKYNAVVELDGSATHLQIEFNDEVGTFALSRGSYQNFNAWTDANDGYRGNYSSTSGVSDVKTRWDAKIGEWEPTRYARPTLWREAFEVEEESIGTGKDYEYYKSGAWTTPNGWSVENGMYVPRERSAPHGLSIQLAGEGKGSLSLNNLTPIYIPNGIGEVEFAARVSQIPTFSGFCYDYFGGTMKDYAVSAKVTMSQDYVDNTYNPLDISPANPSVSLVGYYQGLRNGCYEFRVTRSGEKQISVALYRWRSGVAELLVENIIPASGNATLTSGQIGIGVGGTINTATGGGISNFGNLVLPMASDDKRLNRWTCMCFSLCSDTSTGTVFLDGFLSKARNNSGLGADSANVLRVVAYRDSSSDALMRGGSPGIGSVGCQAGFGLVYTHDFSDTTTRKIDITTGHHHTSVYTDWDYPQENWRPLADGEFGYGAGFTALIPANQTLNLMYQKQGETGWIDSGWETNITAFATNTFLFAPCVPPDYLVRLQTGSGEAEIVVDSVEVKSWRAGDTPNLSSQNGHYDEWAYTMASIETSAEIEGASYQLVEAGTNGYAFIFNEAGTATFTPKIDMVVDRVLLVGGGGAGGGVMGGGGGGGGVREYIWENDPVTISAGTTIRITVGAGGTAPTPQTGSNSTTTQPAGNSGTYSRLTGITGKTLNDASGGGGGAGWSADPKTGGCGGGGSNTRNGANGAVGQGYAGGKANGGTGGGGGGAGGAGQAAENSPNTTGDTGRGGDGGIGFKSDITGTVTYYGGGGGGGAGWVATQTPGEGGQGGGGRGSEYRKKNAVAGTDGLGGGGGGGTWYGSNGPNNIGANGGCGCVILRVRTASKLCVLQPTRSYEDEGEEQNVAHDWTYPMSVRSKYMDNGLSLFSFSYRDADSNAVLRLQISTNMTDYGETYSRTRASADSDDWTTLTNWSFKGLSAKDLAEGTRTYFISLRAPHTGLMRLIMEPSVISNAQARAKNPATRDLDYGKITITRIFCYDEPELDARSWWGWNLHTEGWGGGGDPGRWAYLTDSPDGLSCSLNFSALADDNTVTKPETYGIGLGEPDQAEEYKSNNPFVQCPEMTNGIGSVSFRARTFETNAAAPSVVILYGSGDIGAYQPDELDGQAWKRLAEFVISNNTYQTYSWRTNEMSTAFKAIRLEVGGARNGRESKYAPLDKPWEKPSYTPYRPIQRVFLDEVTVSEPVGPRMKFFDVRPFRSHLTDTSPKAITNINDRNEQPLLGESWGIQARIEPQQMSDELDMDSIVIKMAAYVGKTPWGYQNWKSVPVGAGRYETELVCVDKENLIFRSTYDNPASVISPVSKSGGDSYAVVQYHVWAEYKSKDASEDQEPTRYDLSAADWVKPAWFWPKDLNAEYGSSLDENFSAFTILDTISPGRAWFNEVNYNNVDYNRSDYQFIEFMVPEGVDLTGWAIRLTDDTFRRGFLAELGSVAQPIDSKFGKRPGIDSTNHFTVVTFVPPKGASYFTESESDGTWNLLSSSGLALQDGSLRKENIYGLELIRPSGVVEHQIVTSGTNMWAGSIFEEKGDATNFVNDVKARDGSEAWFYVGEDKGGATNGKDLTIGVWRGHGEQLWDGGPTWTNDLQATPGELNLRNGKRQFLDEWMLPPNGTNIWIYAIVNGAHTWQYVDGNPANTNKNTMMVVKIDSTTNIRYKVDAWYELANCTTNGHEVTPTAVPGQTRTFEIMLPNIKETTTVIVDDQGDSRLFGTNYPWQVAENDPYKPAILDWLLRNWPDGTPDDIKPAEHWTLDQSRKLGDLDLTAMYWLDIPPLEGGWRLLCGMIGDVERFPTEEEGVTYANNAYINVKMLMTNSVSGVFHPPYTLQGMQPGSSSATDYASMSENWTSATFKVMCALDLESQKDAIKPVKWFVFDENSFNADGTARIEIPDQSKPSTPGFNYGWQYYLGTQFFYKLRLDEKPSGLYSTELLRRDHTSASSMSDSP